MTQNETQTTDHRIEFPDGGFWASPEHQVPSLAIRAHCSTCDTMVTVSDGTAALIKDLENKNKELREALWHAMKHSWRVI